MYPYQFKMTSISCCAEASYLEILQEIRADEVYMKYMKTLAQTKSKCILF